MSTLRLPKYSFGVGDRFAREAEPQLRACIMAAERGVEVTPVWNKSHREHSIIGTDPKSQREAADAAVERLGWRRPYFVDADHINLANVDPFLAPCDFFTIDVADSIGRPADRDDVEAFVRKHDELGLAGDVAAVAHRYLAAVKEAARIYRYIGSRKGGGTFVVEVSMDETDKPQTPRELMVILAALADEGVPVETIAPKFSGRFNKGVDYVGDVEQFAREFEEDVNILSVAARRYGLPEDLKLSVHSGSDKFSLYAPIREVIRKYGAGLHLKTAGTTWLEELIGLAEAGGEGLALAKEIYREAHARREELCAPYAAVIDIDPSRLPAPGEVDAWNAEEYAAALRHEPSNPAFNPHFRQLLHVGYKIAAKMGRRYLDMLEACRDSVARNVTANLFERHIKPLFLD